MYCSSHQASASFTVHIAMKWLVILCILAGILLSLTSVVSAFPSSSLCMHAICLKNLISSLRLFFFTAQAFGTYASINYSNFCCPPRHNCQAADGICHCGADCHAFNNCCGDAHCPSRNNIILMPFNVWCCCASLIDIYRAKNLC